MNSVIRKKSPRAPSISLEDAIDKAGKIYDEERCHSAPIDGVAQHIGYKNASNGAALSTLASLKYYGLLDRPKEGMAAVSKQFESFRFAPAEEIKREFVTQWLKSPPTFAELLDKYPGGLPSDATLKFELIQKGFAPAAADVCLQVFRKSVEFARFFELAELAAPGGSGGQAEQTDSEEKNGATAPIPMTQPAPTEMAAQATLTAVAAPTQPLGPVALTDDVDRIPVRLAGGRRAWIEIPMPFYKADKERLKRQIDLLLTNDEDDFDDQL